MRELLHSQSLNLGVVTNGTARAQNKKIEILGVQHLFGAVVVSELEGFKKPDPRLFHVALQQLGLEAASTWFVGDHPLNDILGARGAGLNPVWLSGSHAWPAEHVAPAMTIASLSELPHHVAAA